MAAAPPPPPPPQDAEDNTVQPASLQEDAPAAPAGEPSRADGWQHKHERHAPDSTVKSDAAQQEGERRSKHSRDEKESSRSEKHSSRDRGDRDGHSRSDKDRSKDKAKDRDRDRDSERHRHRDKDKRKEGDRGQHRDRRDRGDRDKERRDKGGRDKDAERHRDSERRRGEKRERDRRDRGDGCALWQSLVALALSLWSHSCVVFGLSSSLSLFGIAMLPQGSRALPNKLKLLLVAHCHELSWHSNCKAASADEMHVLQQES